MCFAARPAEPKKKRGDKLNIWLYMYTLPWEAAVPPQDCIKRIASDDDPDTWLPRGKDVDIAVVLTAIRSF